MSMIVLLTLSVHFNYRINLAKKNNTVQFARAHFHPQITRYEKLYCRPHVDL